MTVPLYARVAPEYREQAQITASALGISLGAYMDRLLAREAAFLDQDGRPLWWNDEEISNDQQELPLGKSA